jgi:NAD(P)-dependent dehydrogenase (short-subunit alcohol dehydrogenase family)
MTVRLKPLGEQVLVITGGSSGIGLVTARLAAAAGARVVLVARNTAALGDAVEAIRERGGRAIAATADVADLEQVQRAAAAALAAFGHIDTWVNNAGVAIYGRVRDVSLADMRRQFDVNYWGTVHGSLVAVRHLEQRGGALINIASAVADRAIPIQGNYCATKHAVKAFTDSLRMELEADGVPISVSLVKPGSMDTPLFGKARTYFPLEPQPVPPVYAPEVAARAILACAERPRRDVIAGGMGKVLSLAGTMAPRLTDRFMERSTIDAQLTDIQLAPERRDNLYQPTADDGGERGAGRNYRGRVKQSSWYTAAALRPKARAAALMGTAAVVTKVAQRRRGSRGK